MQPQKVRVVWALVLAAFWSLIFMIALIVYDRIRHWGQPEAGSLGVLGPFLGGPIGFAVGRWVGGRPKAWLWAVMAAPMGGVLLGFATVLLTSALPFPGKNHLQLVACAGLVGLTTAALLGAVLAQRQQQPSATSGNEPLPKPLQEDMDRKIRTAAVALLVTMLMPIVAPLVLIHGVYLIKQPATAPPLKTMAWAEIILPLLLMLLPLLAFLLG